MLFVNLGFAKTPKYTVTIDKGNGEIITFQIDSASSINQQRYLAPPARNGFIFQGWELVDDIDKPVRRDSVKITAKWVAESSSSDLSSSFWEEKIQPKVEEIVRSIESKINTLFILVIVLAGLAILLTILLFLQKKRFRDNVLFVLTGEKQKWGKSRLNIFKEEIVRKAVEKTKDEVGIFSTSPQPIKINEAEFRRLADMYLISKQPVVEEPIKIKKQETANTISENQSQFLYADVIDNGYFNRVTEQPTPESIFELILNEEGETRAKVIVYSEAYQLVTKRPEFLDGCDKHVIGNSMVTMLNDGIAQKEGGKWKVLTKPEVKIS